MKKLLKIIIPVVIVLALAGLGVVYFLSSRTKYNPENATGNTPGNLLNGGLFCEYNNKIYFANPYDNNCLYVMDSDCTNARKLNSDSVAYLNVYGNYIYYVKNNFGPENIGSIFRGQLYGVYRTDLEGKHHKSLYDKLSGTISLYGNTIYFQHYDNKTALTLYKVGIDGKDSTLISDIEYNPSSISDGMMYFSNFANHNYITTLNTKNDSVSTYYSANSYLVNVTDNYIYYIDLDKNYSLVRMSKGNKTIELLFDTTEEADMRIINYNVYGSKIFFQLEGGSKPGLYRMNTNGTQLEYIASGNLTNIHCTSNYTFFQYYDNQGTLYRVPTSGAISFPEEIKIQINK